MKLASALLLLITLLTWPLLLTAHAPDLHNFRMVTFKRPFSAPGFQLPDLETHMRALSDFQGHYVLLNFWATWCKACLKEMPSLEKLYQRLQSHGFVVVAVSTDTEGDAKVTPFVSKLQLTFPILLDADQAVSKRYGARDLPSSFLLNPQGQVIAAAKGERDWFSEQALSYFDELVKVEKAAKQAAQ